MVARAEKQSDKLRRQVERLEKEGAKRDAALEVPGKNTRALGSTLQKPGLKDVLEPLLPEAVYLGIVAACRITGRSRATHHRRLNPAPPGPRPPRPAPVNALSNTERQAVLELMNRPEYVDLPPAQIYARELDEGRYHCSERTMYRILKKAGQDGERRRQATHPPRTVPELVADGPSQVWGWDITRLAGPAKGVWYHGYVILDIYSRYAVGHTVETGESAERAEELIREAIDRNGIGPHTVHADRGTSMTSKQVSQLLLDLCVTRSHSGPGSATTTRSARASPRTTNYQPDYPERFESLSHAREWMDAFISHYNHVHRHSGIGYHTPASVHFGTAETGP